MMRFGIDAGYFSDDKVEAGINAFKQAGSAGIVAGYVQTRAMLEANAEKTDGWGCKHEEATIEGVSCLWTSWPGQEASQPIVWLHGGAYTLFSPRSYRALAARLSQATGRRVLVPDHSLAPEHPYPTALDEVDRVWTSVAAEGGCALGGDSSGGGLALALMQRLAEQGRAGPTAAVLMAPWVDLSLTAASFDANDCVDSCVRSQLRLSALAYAAGLDPATDAGVSPLRGALGGLAPLLLIVGSCDTLLDDSLELAQRVKAAGGSVRLDVAEAMPHVYAVHAAYSPRAQRAFADAAQFLNTAASE